MTQAELLFREAYKDANGALEYLKGLVFSRVMIDFYLWARELQLRERDLSDIRSESMLW